MDCLFELRLMILKLFCLGKDCVFHFFYLSFKKTGSTVLLWLIVYLNMETERSRERKRVVSSDLI